MALLTRSDCSHVLIENSLMGVANFNRKQTLYTSWYIGIQREMSGLGTRYPPTSRSYVHVVLLDMCGECVQ